MPIFQLIHPFATYNFLISKSNYSEFTFTKNKYHNKVDPLPARKIIHLYRSRKQPTKNPQKKKKRRNKLRGFFPATTPNILRKSSSLREPRAINAWMRVWCLQFRTAISVLDFEKP